MHPFAEAAPARLEALIDVNIKGTLNGILGALPFLKGQGEARIVNMSSASAMYGVPDLAVYSATKFAVRGLTEALNIEFEPMGIWVSDVMVGYVDTPMLSDADATAKSVGITGVNVTPDTVAATVMKAVETRAVHWFVAPEGGAPLPGFAAESIDVQREQMRAITGY